MGLNFYTSDRKHIGKLSYIGKGKQQFTWYTGYYGVGGNKEEVYKKVCRRKHLLADNGYIYCIIWFLEIVDKVVAELEVDEEFS
jgi:hypothetical protein